MHDIKKLEEDWIRYKKNRRQLYYIFGLLFVIIISILVYILTLEKSIESIKKVKNIDTITMVNIEKPLLNGTIDTLALETSIINKSIDMKKTVVRNVKELIPTLPILDNIPVIETVKSRVKSTKNTVRRDILIKKPHKKMYLEITKSSTDSAYKEVEKRFNQFQDPDDSLFLAKSYYAKKEYEKSEYWALRTNKLDKNIEESWMIFVKSKIKLGYTKNAIHILSNYVKQSNSQEAKILLYKLKK
jgi:hypothetical protein